ncbi:MAG: C1 family peptidase [Legionella sp.]
MRLPKLLLASLALSTQVFAQDIKVVGTIEQTLQAPKGPSLNANRKPHSIKLLKIELSQPAVDTISARANLMLKPLNTLTTVQKNTRPRKIALGMNNVPVLDQGSFGSCVTFATTVALNAALNQGDYISQLCQLQLGSYLEHNGYAPSGWNGSLGRTVLSTIESFGVISKEKQRQSGCGGLTEYPSSEQQIVNTEMPLEQFHELSENLGYRATWTPILDIYKATNRVDTTPTLEDVKQSLNENDRVTFAVLLVDLDLGTAGAVGKHSTNNDTWVMTPEIVRDIYLRPFSAGGHEMVITGYDDDAVAIDDSGREHKGLLTLRNSWGKDVGDKGDFYMSYDYFKILVLEAQRINGMPADGGVDSLRA